MMIIIVIVLLLPITMTTMIIMIKIINIIMKMITKETENANTFFKNSFRKVLFC